MKKIISFIMTMLLMVTLCTPLSSADAGNVSELTFSSENLIPESVFYVTGHTTPHGEITFMLTNSMGEQFMVDQTIADATGQFTTNQSLRLPKEMMVGDYNVYINGINVKTISLKAYTLQLSVSKTTVTKGESIEVFAKVIPNLGTNTKKNVEVTFTLLENGAEVSGAEQRLTDVNGEIRFTHKTQYKGSYQIRAICNDQTQLASFVVNDKPVQPPTPVTPPSVPTPSGNAPKEKNANDEKGNPVAGTKIEVKETNNGKKTVKVTVDSKLFNSTPADQKVIDIKVDEEDTKDFQLSLPSDTFKSVAKNEQSIRLSTDKVSVEFSASGVKLEKNTNDVVVKINAMNSNTIEVGIYDAKTLKPLAVEKPIKTQIVLTDEQIKKSRVTVLRQVDEKGNPLKVVGGKVDLETGMIKATLEGAGYYEVFTFESKFKDISEKHWAYNDVSALAARDIFKGESEVKFADKRKISKSEFVATLVRSLKLENSGDHVALNDIGGKWFTNEVEIAAQNGIIPSEGSFKPTDMITREEMAVMLAKALEMKKGKLSVDEAQALKVFGDAKNISSESQSYIAKVAEMGMIKGVDGNFLPTGKASRAEAAAVIFRLLTQLGEI